MDLSQTINLYTDLDAYPLPRVDDMPYNRGGQPFEARVQQKEKSKLRGPHPGNTFITIKKHNLQYEMNQCET